MDYPLRGAGNKRLNNFRAAIFEQCHAFTGPPAPRRRLLFYDAIHVTCRIARLYSRESRRSCKFDRVISELQLSRLAFRWYNKTLLYTRIFRIVCGNAYIFRSLYCISICNFRENVCNYPFPDFNEF